MFTRWRLGTPLRLSLLFVLVAGTLLVALAWLWQSMLAEELTFESKQRRDRLDNAAVVVTHEVERTMAAWETIAAAALQNQHAEPPPQTALLVFGTEGVRRVAGVSLPYLPVVPPVPDARSRGTVASRVR